MENWSFSTCSAQCVPIQVLIIGGGDGGIARELDRYPAVKEVVLCEIDEVFSINLKVLFSARFHLSS